MTCISVTGTATLCGKAADDIPVSIVRKDFTHDGDCHECRREFRLMLAALRSLVGR